MKLFVLDRHTIYRRGLVSCLAADETVEEVAEAGTVAEAWRHPSLPPSDVLVVDPDLAGGLEFVRQVRESTGTSVVVCTSAREEGAVLAAVQAGAMGYLRKETLDPTGLAAAVRAAASGNGVIAPELLGDLMRGLARVSKDVLEPRGLTLALLDDREQHVLRLLAQGLPTREVAARLAYSERTIKNVIHDVVTKLNARTRSQAVAHAVREGLI